MSRSRRIIYQPQTYQEILNGVDRLVSLIRPTLGPVPRRVFYTNTSSDVPEPLDNGGLIAKRIPINEWDASAVGSRLLKSALIQLQEREGDGTAAASVMFQVILHEGVKLIAAGGNAILLRRYLKEGEQTIINCLERQRIPLDGKQGLTHFANSICHHEQLSNYLGEIFDVIGEYGRLDIIKGNGKTLERDFVDGLFWWKGMVSPYMANRPNKREAFLENPAILLTNYYVHDPGPVVELLNAAVQAGFRNLLIVSIGFSEKVIGLFATKSNQEKIWVVGVEAPATGDERLVFLQDIAVLTGATPIFRAGDIETELTFSSLRNLKFVRQEDFGRARRVWVTNEATGISGGKADTRYMRHYIQDLERRHERESDIDTRRKLEQRLSMFLGGSATLRIGAGTPIEISQLTEAANTTARALRGAIHSGVIPGSGSALLACGEDLEQKQRTAQTIEERMAFMMLTKMVQEPARTLLVNSGIEPHPVLEEIRQAGPGVGYDVLRKQIVQVEEAGLYDGLSVIKAAVRTAISTAEMALSTDVILKKPNKMM